MCGCAGDCLSCGEVPGTCNTCNPAASNRIFARNKTCVARCEGNEFVARVGENWFCGLCSGNCRTCTDTSVFCTSCYEGFNLSAAHTCVEWRAEMSSYLVCSSVCRTCFKSPEICTSCFGGYFLWNNTCVLNCPMGMFGMDSVCISCSVGCASCFGRENNCTSCLGSKILYKSSCVDSIPINLWYNTVTMRY